MKLSFQIWIRSQLLCSGLLLLLPLINPAGYPLPVCTAAAVAAWFGGLPMLFLFMLSLYCCSYFTSHKPTILACSVSLVVLMCFTALCCCSVYTGRGWQYWQELPELNTFGAIAAFAGSASVLSYHQALDRQVRRLSF